MLNAARTLKIALFTLISALCLQVWAVDQEKIDTTKATFIENDTAKAFFEKSYGWAIFPTIGKAGIGIGGAYGKGNVYKQGKVTGEASMSQVSIGLQLGGQAYSMIVFFENEKAYNDFTSGNFEFSANANAIAITASAQASAGTTGAGASAGTKKTNTKQKASYTNGMAILQMGKGGLMYEASVAGQKYKFKPNKAQEEAKKKSI